MPEYPFAFAVSEVYDRVGELGKSLVWEIRLCYDKNTKGQTGEERRVCHVKSGRISSAFQ